uniref:Cation transporter n=1 Tax=Ammonifex degensii TaxID=42838 RepID=A0A7C1J7Q2_9THEO
MSVATSLTILSFKLAAGVVTGSVGVLSEAAHSGMDVLAGLVTYFSLRAAQAPPDERHRFGHGKFENLAAVIEGGFIFLVAALIFAESVRRFFVPRHLFYLDTGIAVMALSAGVNFFLSRYLIRLAHKTGSAALLADGLHLLTDVYASAGVFVSLILIRLTKRIFFDPLTGIAVAFLLLRTAYFLLRDALQSFLDVRLPEEEEALIREVLERFRGEYVSYHNLRSRRAGAERHVDLHLVLPYGTTVATGSALVWRIKKAINECLPRTHVLISTDPCDATCEECSRYCPEPNGIEAFSGENSREN